MLLSELPDAEVRRIYAAHNSIPSYPAGMDALLAKLAEVRALGYARVPVPDDRKHHVVAVTTGDPAHAGLALSGWIPEAATEELVAALRVAAVEVG